MGARRGHRVPRAAVIGTCGQPGKGAERPTQVPCKRPAALPFSTHFLQSLQPLTAFYLAKQISGREIGVGVPKTEGCEEGYPSGSVLWILETLLQIFIVQDDLF